MENEIVTFIVQARLIGSKGKTEVSKHKCSLLPKYLNRCNRSLERLKGIGECVDVEFGDQEIQEMMIWYHVVLHAPW